MNGGGSGGRTSYKDQITVSGEFGSRTVKRGEDADVGNGDAVMVVAFDGVVNYKDDALLSPVSVSEGEREAFIDSVDDRLSEYEIHDFEEDDE